ncbi:MAG: Nramp family divalent metal transporter [Blastocatellales bacterium]
MEKTKAVAAPDAAEAEAAPWPGSRAMPRWEMAELDDAPKFTGRKWAMMLGPGLLMSGASIGAGEWLLGPAVTARYGGALLWVTTLSILAQVIYNLEISRYTLYCGEPIMNGKFRTLPGPAFWLWFYLILDLGALLPYQIGNVSTTVAAMWMGRIPDPGRNPADASLLYWLTFGMLILSLIPLLFGGKIYNSLKAVITVKIVVVLGFLTFLGVFFSSFNTWVELFTGFFKFGNVPVDGGGVKNVFVTLWHGEGLPKLSAEALPLLTSFAAIAGVGGMAQTSISNYTRDQGWGMGGKVGAIPSIIGGRDISLSHSGKVFEVNKDSMPRWKRWMKHIRRDQLALWMPAAFIGLALPSMLSVEFLPRGTSANSWVLAGMTADGVMGRIGGTLGAFCWYMILFCGFLALLPNSTANADGFMRRWVDVCWSSAKWMRKIDPRKIGKLYFGILIGYFVIAAIFLSFASPRWLIVVYGNLGNVALGISCWHTLYVNSTLLPDELKPGLWPRIGLFLAGSYFLSLAILTLLISMKWI